MADFCKACTSAMFDETEESGERNDFVGWLDAPGLPEPGLERAWGLCEGCGVHVFDNAGGKLCGTRGMPENRPNAPGWGDLKEGCSGCRAAA